MNMHGLAELINAGVPWVVVILIALLIFEKYYSFKQIKQYQQLLDDFKRTNSEQMKMFMKEVKKILSSMNDSMSVIRDAMMELKGMIIKNGTRR